MAEVFAQYSSDFLTNQNRRRHKQQFDWMRFWNTPFLDHILPSEGVLLNILIQNRDIIQNNSLIISLIMFINLTFTTWIYPGRICTGANLILDVVGRTRTTTQIIRDETQSTTFLNFFDQRRCWLVATRNRMDLWQATKVNWNMLMNHGIGLLSNGPIGYSKYWTTQIHNLDHNSQIHLFLCTICSSDRHWSWFRYRRKQYPEQRLGIHGNRQGRSQWFCCRSIDWTTSIEADLQVWSFIHQC